MHTIAIVTSPMSVHTLRIQKKKSLSSSNYTKIKFEKVEDRETMEVLSPYLAAFGTIASLYPYLHQFRSKEKGEKMAGSARLKQIVR